MELKINNYQINIIKKGTNTEKGIYIGRPSQYSNPFPTKPSSFSDEIYKIEDSLKLFEEHLNNKIDTSDLLKKLKEEKTITLSCFCTNKQIKGGDNIHSVSCHGELIAKKVFKDLELELIKENKMKLGFTGHANIEKAFTNYENVKKNRLSENQPTFRGKFNYLSNMYSCNIKMDSKFQEEFSFVELNDMVFKSVEHAYFYQMSEDIEWRRLVLNTEKPNVVKQLANKYINNANPKYKKKENWGEIKLEVMKCLIHFKFNQNEDLKEKLLETGDLHIEEANDWKDKFWGTYKGEGENNLGKIIMEIRNQISNNINSNNYYNPIIYKKVYKEISDMIERFLSDKSISKEDLCIVSGMAAGVDEIAAHYAMNNNLPLILCIPDSIKWHQGRKSRSDGSRAQAYKYNEILDYVKTRIEEKCPLSKINEIPKFYKGKEYQFANFARNQNIIDESDFVMSYKKYASPGTTDAIKSAKEHNKYYGNVCGFEGLKNILKPLHIKYDTDLFEENTHILIQGCNCFNTMGAGVAKIIREKYPEAYLVDNKTIKGDRTKLGTFSFVDVNPNNEKNKPKFVVNLYSQFTFYDTNDMFYIDEFENGMKKIINYFLKERKNSNKIIFSMPAIGLGLANGKIEEVYSVLNTISNKYKDENIEIKLCLHPKDKSLNNEFRKLENDYNNLGKRILVNTIKNTTIEKSF